MPLTMALRQTTESEWCFPGAARCRFWLVRIRQDHVLQSRQLSRLLTKKSAQPSNVIAVSPPAII